MQAYVPATLAVTLYRKAGKPVKVGKAVIRHYRAAGTRSVCYRLPKKPKGWYAKRSFYWLFAVQRGFKPAKGAHATTHKTVVKIRL